MTLLLLGLLLFLGVHSLRVFGDAQRTAWRERLGEVPFKGLYSVVSLAGFVLIVVGYGQARLEPVLLWMPPVGMRHLAALLTLLSFVLLAAAYVPRNAIKARLRHPMTLAVKVWALAHLLANGGLHDVLLFGGFLLWSVLVFRAARSRDRAAGTVAAPASGIATGVTVVAGIVAWTGFAMWAHAALIGVRPFG